MTYISYLWLVLTSFLSIFFWRFSLSPRICSFVVYYKKMFSVAALWLLVFLDFILLLGLVWLWFEHFLFCNFESALKKKFQVRLRFFLGVLQFYSVYIYLFGCGWYQGMFWLYTIGFPEKHFCFLNSPCFLTHFPLSFIGLRSYSWSRQLLGFLKFSLNAFLRRYLRIVYWLLRLWRFLLKSKPGLYLVFPAFLYCYINYPLGYGFKHFLPSLLVSCGWVFLYLHD